MLKMLPACQVETGVGCRYPSVGATCIELGVCSVQLFMSVLAHFLALCRGRLRKIAPRAKYCIVYSNCIARGLACCVCFC